MPNVLTQKSYIKYDKLSRYNNFPTYFHTVDNKYTYGFVTKLKKDIPFTSYTIHTGDTLDILALKFYNNPTYYWIIADYNNIIDCYKQLRAGDCLKIPSISNIEFE